MLMRLRCAVVVEEAPHKTDGVVPKNDVSKPEPQSMGLSLISRASANKRKRAAHLSHLESREANIRAFLPGQGKLETVG